MMGTRNRMPPRMNMLTAAKRVERAARNRLRAVTIMMLPTITHDHEVQSILSPPGPTNWRDGDMAVRFVVIVGFEVVAS